jgi:hypothetical protein
VATADFNSDGKLDLASTNASANSVSVLLGTGSGGFAAANHFPAGTDPRSVTVADFNNDGNLDLATANKDSYAVRTPPYDVNRVSVMLGDGLGHFAAPVNAPSIYGLYGDPISMAVGDFNRDSKMDLAVTTKDNFDDTGGYLNLMLGDGQGGIVGSYLYNLTSGSPTGLAVADLNADGKPDVVTTTDTSFAASVMLGNGDGTLGSPSLFGTGGQWPRAVTVGDFTSDGIPDLVAIGLGSGWANVLPGVGNGTFAAAIPNVSYLGDSIATADFNGDGKLDAVTGYWSGENLSLLLGRGNGTFAPPAEPWAGYSTDGVAVGDFNGDTRPDVATADYTLSAVSVLLNGGDWATKTWIGPTSGSWSTAANWSPGGVPAASDLVTIAGKVVTLSASAAIANLTLTGGATLTLAANGNRVLRTSSLSVSPTSKLNLNDNDLILDYAGASPIGGWNGSAYTGITGLIQSGRTPGGTWNGAGGIGTAMPKAIAGLTTLGVAEAADVLFLSGNDTALWGGQTVDATTVIVKYTYVGDADLNGYVDAADYGVIDNFIQFPGASGYFNGDFNFDGVIDAADYGHIDNSIQLQGAPL